jgi:hypothetical protein
MTVFVFRNGLIIPKGSAPSAGARCARSDLPAPMLSRMEPFESPVTGKEISSWRERDRDMAAADAVDPRDMPPPTRGRPKKGETHGRK